MLSPPQLTARVATLNETGLAQKQTILMHFTQKNKNLLFSQRDKTTHLDLAHRDHMEDLIHVLVKKR